MQRDPFYYVKAISKWRFVFMLVAALACAWITVYILKLFIIQFVNRSTTLWGLYIEFIQLFGPAKYNQYIESFGMIFQFLCILGFFILYIYLFYERAKRSYHDKCFQNMLREISYIAKGNFTHKLNAPPIKELEELAMNVDNIVEKLKISIQEERLAEQAKNELITNVSHDLRTPLTSLIGYIGLIQQDQYRDEVELRYYIEVINEKVIRLHQLIQDLFEYTRVQYKGAHLHKIPVNISEIVGQLTAQYRYQMQEAKLECRQFISSGKLMVLADSNKLGRVFENLLWNAIKYGKDGKYIDIHACEDHKMIKVTITNYGSPISKIDLPYIFERFYRVEKSRSEETGGSGLGLAIAKGIIEQHEGFITADSNGEKTIFTVKLLKLEKEESSISSGLKS
ncbi:sensor histidine kinase [Bacillus chungangensis]|uniref:histidine kinase n=1 Tax=Bacillus chungangensis TaxID=587633 RepID=A0ABT9WUV9_9BACI|nr:HAMP domain-containing sensor histidine kinase [Bacillus chungangensis]MDQ0176990.1 signal transduction histidine kinase [Bacillus chungangensis]